ncbi:Regulator of chromosome condensation (RCC1) family with FYVE zinc finger domain-containing protein [Quillaja saponaria]|uniref:Regulator of chromosome condensation (RCC1) family with FYVE zinc finger domain-containing protein n=1 Tax=Quillaja saponaria TaxID=32244 RepID=A0AAD7PR30_QUISA|nr:Regulator of chromosome condensation (RCC1) family with FYVE zinc finger domain-containing protein [Quillaja saponaria]
MPTMGEESLAEYPFDRAVQKAVLSIKRGAYLLKCGRRGKPKFCPFRLSTDEKFLSWYSGEQEKHLRLGSVTKIIQGQSNLKFQKQILPERECQSFSLIYANGERSLDLICKDKEQATSWFVGLRAVISRCNNPRQFTSLRSCKGVQSCASSPAGFIRRKRNLGLVEHTTEFSKVQSVCASPTLSLSDRCFSDGLSHTSDSFYSSESILSNMQNVADISIPSSPYNDLDELKRIGSTYIDTKYEKNVDCKSVSSPSMSPRLGDNSILKDVMVWGEGTDGGIVGSAVDRSGDYNRSQSDAVLPKLLDSTMMLDVQNISLGGKHAALATKQGELFCWGQGKGGRLGHKVDIDVSSPKIVGSLNGVVNVKYACCGEYHTCALTDSGEVYIWGDDGCGPDFSGEERYTSQWIPRKLCGSLDGISISHIACGEWHTAIVSSCGRIFTYGDGTFGVLGHGNLHSFSQPKEVESLKGLRVRSVACGSWHTAAVVEVVIDGFRYNTASGKLFTWGDGDQGRLGHAGHERKLLPTHVAQLEDYDFVQVSCGRMLTVALTSLGAIFTMGSAVHGQLGNPQVKDKSITIVEGKLKEEFVKEVASGSYHVAVLTSKGSVYTWGRGANGQLGLGDTKDRSTPTWVEALKDRQVESIACGSSLTAAICLHKPISVSDLSACGGCKLPFGFTRKRHNCYNCGLLFCSACSGKKVVNASLAPNNSKAFRVCDRCFNNRQRNTHIVMASKTGNFTEKLLIQQNIFPDQKENKGEATPRQNQLLSMRQSCIKKSTNFGWKDWKNERKNPKHLESIGSLLGGLPRWGQVPCPVPFKTHHTENSVVHTPQSTAKSPLVSSLHVESTVPSILEAENGISNSDDILMEEVQKLTAEARSLEEQCQIRSHKIQESQKKTEETWLLAREEATKYKAAKDVVKALALTLHTMLEKVQAGLEGKNGSNESLPQLMPVHTDNSGHESSCRNFVATHLPLEAGSLKDSISDSLSNSPVLFSAAMKSENGRNVCNESNYRSVGDSHVTRTECQDKNTGLNFEWVEQYEAGVYLTFLILPSGQKGLKRVRFSKKRFTQKEAEQWWDDNQIIVSQKYDIDEYVNSNQNQMKV